MSEMPRGGSTRCLFRSSDSVTSRRHGHITLLLSLTLLIISINGSEAAFNKGALIGKLFDNYTKELRPQCNGTDIVTVSVDLALQQIIELDEAKQHIATSMWFRLEWVDCHFGWLPEDFDGVKHIVVYSTKIWVPDITLYQNSFGDGLTEAMREFRAIIYHNGKVVLNFPHVVHSVCPIDVTYFPFDTQKCTFKLGTWAYHGLEVDVVNTRKTGDATTYVSNGEWKLLLITVATHKKYYVCCPEPYPDVTFVLYLKRMPLFYMFNLVFPCMLISFISMLSFCLPPESGEKVSLGITVLLSLTVFLLIVSESMPATSDTIPMIGQYFAATIVLVSLSCLMTVMVLNVHFRGNNGRQVPNWVRKLVLEFLGKVLFVAPMVRGKVNYRKSKVKRYAENTRDMNAIWNTYANGTSGQAYANVESNVNSFKDEHAVPSGIDDIFSNNFHGVGNVQEMRELQRDSDQQHNVLSILENHMDDYDREDMLDKEWRQVALVLDRLFLYLYVTIAVITPTGIFLKATGQ